VLEYNMALSGAVVDADIITSTTHDVDCQVHKKFEHYSNQINSFLASTSRSLWTGINDINRSYNGTDPTVNFNVIVRYKELVKSPLQRWR
jgi:hypothetical protein